MEPTATANGSAHAPGMQQLMALLQQQTAAPPPASELAAVSRADAERAALADAHAYLADDNEDDDSDGEGTKSRHFKEAIDLETAKAEKRNREAAKTYYNWPQVKMEAQEIAKTRASYRRLLVVALGQLKRIRAVAAALPVGPLCLEQEAIIATAEQEVKYLKGQTTILKGMADACIFADDTRDSAAYFAMGTRQWPLVRKGQSELNRILLGIRHLTAYAHLLEKPEG